jgi:hypothetical protein
LSPHPPGSLRCIGGIRRDEAQRLEVRARSVPRDAASRERVKVQRVSSSGARQPGRLKTRMVAFGHATEKVAGFLALPRDQGRHRAIIVIHEWWGLNEWVKDQAEKLAANGNRNLPRVL